MRILLLPLLVLSLLTGVAQAQLGILQVHVNQGASAPGSALRNNLSALGFNVQAGPPTTVDGVEVHMLPSLPNGDVGCFDPNTGVIYLDDMFDSSNLSTATTALLFAATHHELHHSEYVDHMNGAGQMAACPNADPHCLAQYHKLVLCHFNKHGGACAEKHANSGAFKDLCDRAGELPASSKERAELEKHAKNACKKAKKFDKQCQKAETDCGGSLGEPPGSAPLPPKDCKCS